MGMFKPSGRPVVFRTPAKRDSDMKPLRVGIVIGAGQVPGTVRIRAACGGRRYWKNVGTYPETCVARDASEREQVLGYPVDPVARPAEPA